MQYGHVQAKAGELTEAGGIRNSTTVDEPWGIGGAERFGERDRPYLSTSRRQ